MYVINPILVPNKNATSFYDKKDVSYLIPNKYKYNEYFKETDDTIIFIFAEDVLFVVKHTIKYKSGMSEEEETDYFTKNEHEIIEKIQLDSEKICSDGYLINLLKNISTVKSENTFVQLVFSDFYNRNSIIYLIDIFLKKCSFKGIHLVTFGMLLSIKLRQGIAAFKIFYGKSEKCTGFVFMDDFSVMKTALLEKDKFILNNNLFNNEDTNYDIADEFNILKSIDYNNKYRCTKCDCFEETEEKVVKHIEKEHKLKEISEIKENIFELTNTQDFEQLTKYLYSKKKKVGENIYEVRLLFDFNKEGSDKKVEANTNKIDVTLADLIEEAFILRNLEVGKELWLTDKEWEIGRVRILKEKVLFYI